jgi:anaerobic ribonucleoside-triphosphate reductase
MGNPLLPHVQPLQNKSYQAFYRAHQGTQKRNCNPQPKARRKAMKKEAKKLVGEGVKFQRIRRITGYLVGSLDRFNDAKRAEEKDRVKHI